MFARRTKLTKNSIKIFVALTIMNRGKNHAQNVRIINMGVEYYIINRKNKTAYDLGKGSWYALNDDKECFQDLEYLQNYIITECWYGLDPESNYYNEDEKQDIKKYIADKIAPDLFEFCKATDPKDIFIFNDSGDDITICRALGYRFVGLRYLEKNEEAYQESLDFMNRHLKDDCPKHIYNPENFKNYPEYEMYK